MSNNIIIPGSSLPHIPGAPSPDVRARMLSDCLDSLSQDFKPSTDTVDVALQRGLDARKTVIAEIRPLLTNPTLALDETALNNIRTRASFAYAECFSHWPQEDLIMLLTVLHTDMLWRKIKEQVGI